MKKIKSRGMTPLGILEEGGLYIINIARTIDIKARISKMNGLTHILLLLKFYFKCEYYLMNKVY